MISIIVPIYNVEKYLRKCVDSLINQTYQNIEIILVDDESPDNCPKICDELAKKDHRIKVIHKKNGGLSDARNCGLKIAKGKYVMFVDSDDYVSNTMVEDLVKLKEKNNAQISICNRIYVDENGNEKYKYQDNDKTLIMNREESLVELCSFRSFDMSAWAKLYDISLFKDIEFPVGKLCEDYYIMYKLFDKCNKIVYTSKAGYYYLQRNGSITKTNKRILMDYIYAAKEQLEFIEKKYPSNIHVYARTAYALSFTTVYNQCLYNGYKLEKEKIKDFKTKMKPYLIDIKHNKSISLIRKIQIHLFIYSIPLYDILIKFYKKM